MDDTQIKTARLIIAGSSKSIDHCAGAEERERGRKPISEEREGEEKGEGACGGERGRRKGGEQRGGRRPRGPNFKAQFEGSFASLTASRVWQSDVIELQHVRRSRVML